MHDAAQRHVGFGPWRKTPQGEATMSSIDWREFPKRRRLGAVIAPLLLALLAASCGGGGSSDAALDATAAVDGHEAATQVAAPGGDAALAVEATRAHSLRAHPNPIRQVIVFGDSLSDVGTYKVGSIAAIGGGKFTTNPGPVWPETVGLVLGARVTPFRQGYGATSTVLGGTGFAMGGSRVSQQPGVDCNPDPFPAGACTAQLTIPIAQQVSDYLAANGDRFTRDQIVFIQGGANDISFQLSLLPAGVVSPSEAVAAVGQAAGELAAQARRILAKGATRVVVLNLPEIADTPAGKTQPQFVRDLLTLMVSVFNDTLAAGLSDSDAKLFNAYAAVKGVFANPGAYLVRELNVPACDRAKIEAITHELIKDGTSLFCSRQTLVQNGAPLTYFFADGKHPTTLGHLIIARFVLIEVWKQGLLTM
jgi:phospholipase/lecithinase/hemolysin